MTSARPGLAHLRAPAGLPLALALTAASLCGAACATPGTALRFATLSPEIEPLRYFVGSWSATLVNPQTKKVSHLAFRVAPTLEGMWLLGQGESPELALKIHDLWGKDSYAGEIVRVVFDSRGTHATLRSRGWDGNTLRFEGEARGDAELIPVRETITRVGPDEFSAVWEAKSGEVWKAYSLEKLVRVVP